jgi:hypothetical protein
MKLTRARGKRTSHSRAISTTTTKSYIFLFFKLVVIIKVILMLMMPTSYTYIDALQIAASSPWLDHCLEYLITIFACKGVEHIKMQLPHWEIRSTP